MRQSTAVFSIGISARSIKRFEIVAQKMGPLSTVLTFQNSRHSRYRSPPFPEQRAIVAKIEAIFSELDKGVESLEATKTKLKVYRQAVLKAAFEGKLTKTWRVENHEEDNRGNTESGYPMSWSSSPTSRVFDSISNGFSGKPDEQGAFEILRISAVRSLSLDVTDTRKIMHCLSDSDEIRENDILFTRYNGSKAYTGVCARVGKLDRRLFYPDKIIRCRKAGMEGQAKYLEYVYTSPKVRGEIDKRIKTTAGQHGISGADIKALVIPLPTTAEQSRIVSEIESRLSLADKLEETIDEGLAKAASLRQSILKQAFEGKLLSEAELEAARREPDWESAEALLERIKAERESALSMFYSAKRIDLMISFSTAAWLRVDQVIGMGFLFVPITLVAYIGIPAEKNNAVAGIVNFMRNIGSSVGTSLVTTLIARRTQYHQEILGEYARTDNPNFQNAANGIALHLNHSGLPAQQAKMVAYASIYRGLQAQAGSLAYIDTFMVLSVGAAIMFFLAFI